MDPSTGAVQPASGGAPPSASPYNQMINPPNMAMLNVNNLLNVKDSRWLQLEVCREFQRNKCTRPDTECKFAHPPPNVEVQNGRVTACYDSIKGRCNREKPPCKYFHPPQHLKDQLLINGRNHLALKNALMTQIHGLPPTTSVMPGTLQMVSRSGATAPPSPLDNGGDHCRWSHYSQHSHPVSYQPTASPYLQGIPTMGGFGPYLASSSPVMTMGVNDAMSSQIAGVLPQQVLATQKLPRTDRLETFPGVVPYKRTATEKSGVPMFQPSNAAYQQALMQQLGTQTYVPVSCEYGRSQASAAAAAAAATNAVSSESAPPRTTTASPTVTDISVSSTNTSTSNSSTISSSTSNSHNALVPVNSSKDSSSLASSSQAITLTNPSHAVASSPLNNLFPYPYKAVRPALRAPSMLPPTAHPPPSMGLSPYAFSQPPPHQALGVSYVNSPVVSVAGMMPYGAQSPAFVHTGGSAAAAAAAAAASGLHGLTAASAAAAYSPAGIAAGTTAVQHSPQFVYSSLPYPMSSFMMPQHSAAAFSTAASQYGSWAAAAAAQAAAAAAGTTEQPYKKLKTV